MPLLLDLFLTFLKIGAVSFGGGYGMIPMLTDEVISHGWLTETELMNCHAFLTTNRFMKLIYTLLTISIQKLHHQQTAVFLFHTVTEMFL